jgi:hypothetical protein
MKFTWKTTDGKIHEKIFTGTYEERLEFIGWLEWSPGIVWWR